MEIFPKTTKQKLWINLNSLFGGCDNCIDAMYTTKKMNATIEYAETPVVKRKMFLIRVNNNLPYPEWQDVIAHEMVHARQYYTRQLIRNDRLTFLWKNRKYPLVNHIKHFERPWEIEAFAIGKLLTDYYTDLKNQSDNPDSIIAFEPE